MSLRYKGARISATPPTTSASSAPGLWTLPQQFQAQLLGSWPSYPPYLIGTLTSASQIYGKSAVADSSGNIYIAGGDYSLYLNVQKLNPFGVIQWQKQLQYYGNGYDIAIDSASNVYIANTNGSPSGIGVVKYNSSGTLQWQKLLQTTYSTPYAYGIAVDGSDNVYVVGSSTMDAGGRRDIELAKYNSSGGLQWQRTLFNSNTSDGYSIKVSSAGNVYIAATGVPSSTYDMLVAKYNTSGTIQWQRYIDASSTTEFGRSIAIDSSENVYVIGEGYSPAYCFIVAKLDTSGTLQWSRTLTTGTTKTANGAAVDSSGNIYITGIDYSSPFLWITAKYNTSGVIQWQRSFTNLRNSSSTYNRLKVDSKNALLLVADATISGTDNQVLLRFPSDGSKTGSYTVGAFSTTYAASSLTDASGSFTASPSAFTAASSSLTDTSSTMTEVTTSFTATTTLI